MKPQWLNRGLVTGPYYTLCLDEKDFHREMRRMKLPRNVWPAFMGSDHADATAHILENPTGDLCVVVCLAGWASRKPIEVAGLLVHEAVHIWQEFCARIGENKPSAEFEAYSIQLLSQELMFEFARQTQQAR